MTTFSEYRIPPYFFGPFQFVDYVGIGGNFITSVDDEEFIIKTENKDSRKQVFSDLCNQLENQSRAAEKGRSRDSQVLYGSVPKIDQEQSNHEAEG